MISDRLGVKLSLSPSVHLSVLPPHIAMILATIIYYWSCVVFETISSFINVRDLQPELYSEIQKLFIYLIQKFRNSEIVYLTLNLQINAIHQLNN